MTILSAQTRYPVFPNLHTGKNNNTDNNNHGGGAPPDMDSSECSGSDDDTSSVVKKEIIFSSKVDQDVAVFTTIAEQLSLASLLFLLQGHVRSTILQQQQCQSSMLIQAIPETKLPSTYLEAKKIVEKQQQITEEKKESSDPNDDEHTTITATSTSSNTSTNKRKKNKKQFRFALIRGGNDVRSIIYEIEPLKDFKNELWWSDSEMHLIRKDAIDTMKYFKKFRPDYVKVIENIVYNIDVEKNMKTIIHDLLYARGLEVHIVTMLSNTRKQIVSAVLQEQRECRMCCDTYELSCESIRSAAIQISKYNAQFANKMAECDQIEALKCIMSKWEVYNKNQQHRKIF